MPSSSRRLQSRSPTAASAHGATSWAVFCSRSPRLVSFWAAPPHLLALINSCTYIGQVNAFGVFQTYYAEVLLREYTLSAISWIGSVQLVIMYITGIILGRAFDIYGARVCSILRSLLVLSLLTQPPISAIACHWVDPFHVLAHDDLLVPRILSTHARTRDRTRPWNCVTVRSLRCARTLATHLPLPWQVLSHCVNFALTPYTLR